MHNPTRCDVNTIVSAPTGVPLSTVTLPSGRRIAYESYGALEGAPVLFFQGTPSSRLMHPPDAITNEQNVRLVVIDRPGFGGSDPAPGRTLLNWAEDVGYVMDHLQLAKFRVVGVSGGAPYALATAWRWPDRVLAGCVCAGSGPLDVPGALRGAAMSRQAGYWVARRWPWLLRRAIRRQTQQSIEEFARRYTAHNPAADQALIAQPEFRAMYVANLKEGLRQGWQAFAADVMLVARPWGFDLGEIRVPVHFWHGDRDTSTPLAMSEGMAARIPRSALTTLAGHGHLFVFGPLWRPILTDLLTTG